MPSEQWQERVKRAQQMAAERLGVDVSVMLPPRQPGAGGAEADAVVETERATETQPVAATQTAQAAPVVQAQSAAAMPAAPSPAAQRIADAKARAAARSTNGGAATAAPAVRPATPVAQPAASTTAAESDAEELGQEGINRREFLTYAWGAALGLLTLEIGVTSYFFMYPRFRAGEFGGKFNIGAVSAVPAPDVGPDPNTTGKFWLVGTEEGPRALYMVCTHLGCLYKWEPANFRFECPCHGSKFSHDGFYIEGPAPRSLDQFHIEIVENGQVVSQTEDVGDAVMPPQVPSPDAQIVIDTGRRIVGRPSNASPARAET